MNKDKKKNNNVTPNAMLPARDVRWHSDTVITITEQKYNKLNPAI
jgi:hypothetical protein